MQKQIIILFLLLAISAVGQEKYPQDYFQAPVDIKLLLSGNFAELRGGHFHSGIDFTTQGKEGWPVKASAEGYISRIKVSPAGFGHTLYITHPNGFTTVYAHLQKFRDDIMKYVREQQYAKESFSVNLMLSDEKFVVKKGELIAWSGNTGSSGGPHLHFEIRDTHSQHPLNPLQFGFAVKDDIRPKVMAVHAIPVGEKATIAGKAAKKRYETVFYDGAYYVRKNPVIGLNGEIGFAIQTNDYLNDSWAKCGVYSIDLFIDNEKVYGFQLDEFSFSETRYLNSHIDYAEYKKHKRRIHKCFVDPGNKLSIYKNLKNRGVVDFNDGKKHEVKFVVADVYGNKSEANLTVLAGEGINNSKEENDTPFLAYDRENSIEKEGFQLKIPAGALYTNVPVRYTREKGDPPFPSIHNINDESTPLHKYCTVSIKSDSMPKALQDKAALVLIDEKTGKQHYAGGAYSEGWVRGKIRTFGKFAVGVDTIAPVIIPLSIRDKKQLIHKNSISFRIKDDFSGIGEYRGEIDGKWVLFEHDPKRKKIYYYFDKECFEFGKKHHLSLTVKDNKGNESVYTADFFK